MIRYNIRINKYNWNVVLLINVGADDIDDVIQHLLCIYAGDKNIKAVINNINDGENNAITVSNINLQKSVVSINNTTSDVELVNSVVHECRHIQSHIASKYRLDEKGEDVAYMIGDMVAMIYSKMRLC